MKTITKACVSILIAIVSTTTSAEQLGGLFWDPNQNGMGTPVTHQVKILADGTRQDIVFGVWFLFAPSGDPTWLSFICNPITKNSTGRYSCTGPLYRVRGSQPMGYDPNRFSPTSPGTFTITYKAPGSVSFVYSFDGQSGTLNWVPQVFGTEYTYAIWTTSAYPVAVAKTGVTPVVNKTQYASLFNCQLPNTALSDGKIAVSCQERPSLARRNFYIDPLKNEIYEYVGTVPANITFSDTVNNSDKPEWGAKARVADGWYFTTANITWVLNFQSDSGTVTTIKAGTFAADGNIKGLVTYRSN